MKLLFEDTGKGFFGMTWGDTFLLSPGWRMPGSKFKVYEDKIVLKIWPKTFTLPLDKIISVKVQHMGGIAGYLKFKHSIPSYPSAILFYCWDSEKVSKLLEKKGVRIENAGFV